MPNYVDPSAFMGQPMFLRAIAEDDYGVMVAGMTAGRIMLQPRSGGQEVWLWTITGPYLPDHLRPSNGEEGTLAEAKAAFRKKFDAWLSWANGLQQQVVWNVVVERRQGG